MFAFTWIIVLNIAGYLTENRKCNKVEVELDLVEGGSSSRGFHVRIFVVFCNLLILDPDWPFAELKCHCTSDNVIWLNTEKKCFRPFVTLGANHGAFDPQLILDAHYCLLCRTYVISESLDQFASLLKKWRSTSAMTDYKRQTPNAGYRRLCLY